MQINWLEYDKKDHVLAWLVCEAVSENIEQLGKFDASKMDVELVVNGVSYDIVKACEFLQSQLDRLEKSGYDNGFAAAVERIKENIDDVVKID